MNYICLGFALFFLIPGVFSESDREESFAIPKKHQQKTAAHLKEELGLQLEELAHLLTDAIQSLAKSQKQLLTSMRRLLEGENKTKHAILQRQVTQLEEKVHEAQKMYEQLIKLNYFLEGI